MVTTGNLMNTAVKTRRPATKKFHKRRDTIVRAAIEMINHKGVRGMTLADIAKQLDQVPTAVMYYFRRKEQLAAECYYRAIERYEQIIAPARKAETAQDALELMIRG